MKTLALALFVAGSAAGQVSIGINIGGQQKQHHQS